MHPYSMPAEMKARIVSRMGREHADAAIEAGRTAFVVVDMQNYFVAEGFSSAVPMARAIVPAINRMAEAVRKAGGLVVWVQTSKEGADEHWRNFQKRMMTPERQAARLKGLDEASEGFKLYAPLDAHEGDPRVKKMKFSAFIPGSSTIDAELRRRGIDAVLVGGTLTNVCCESTARDAMLLDYRVAMIADCNATLTDAEHSASLNTFGVYFGDVLTVDQAIGKLVPVSQRLAGE